MSEPGPQLPDKPVGGNVDAQQGMAKCSAVRELEAAKKQWMVVVCVGSQASMSWPQGDVTVWVTARNPKTNDVESSQAKQIRMERISASVTFTGDADANLEVTAALSQQDAGWIVKGFDRFPVKADGSTKSSVVVLDKAGRPAPRSRNPANPIVLAFANGVLELGGIGATTDIVPRLKTALRWKGATIPDADVERVRQAVEAAFAEGHLVVPCKAVTVLDGKDGKPSNALLRYLKNHGKLRPGADQPMSPPAGWDPKWDSEGWRKRGGCPPWEALLDQLEPDSDKSVDRPVRKVELDAYERANKKCLGSLDLYRNKNAFSEDHPLKHVPGLSFDDVGRIEDDLPGNPVSNGGLNFAVERWPREMEQKLGPGIRILCEVRLSDARNSSDDSVTLSLGFRWKDPAGKPSDGEENACLLMGVVRPLAYRARLVYDVSFADLLDALRKYKVDIKEFVRGDEMYVSASFNNTELGTAFHYHGRKDRGGRFRIPVDGFEKQSQLFFDESISDISDINLSTPYPEMWRVPAATEGNKGMYPWLLGGGKVTTSFETESEFFIFKSKPGQDGQRRREAIKALETVVRKMAALVDDKDLCKKVFNGDAHFTVRPLPQDDKEPDKVVDGAPRASLAGKGVLPPKIFLDHYLDFENLILVSNGAILRLRERPRAKEVMDLLAAKGAAKKSAARVVEAEPIGLSLGGEERHSRRTIGGDVQVRYCAQLELEKIDLQPPRWSKGAGKPGADKAAQWATRNSRDICNFIQKRTKLALYRNPLRPVLCSLDGLKAFDEVEKDFAAGQPFAERLKIRSIRYRYKIGHTLDSIDVDFSADFATGWLPGESPSATEEEASVFKEGTYEPNADDAAPLVLAFELGLGHLGINAAQPTGAVGKSATTVAQTAPVSDPGGATTPSPSPKTAAQPATGAGKRKLVGGGVLHTRASFENLDPVKMSGHERFAGIVAMLKSYLLEGLGFGAEPGGNKVQVMAQLLGLKPGAPAPAKTVQAQTTPAKPVQPQTPATKPVQPEAAKPKPEPAKPVASDSKPADKPNEKTCLPPKIAQLFVPKFEVTEDEYAQYKKSVVQLTGTWASMVSAMRKQIADNKKEFQMVTPPEFERLREEEQVILFDYTRSLFEKLNPALYKGNESDLEKHKLKIKLLISALQKLPDFTGPTYRSAKEYKSRYDTQPGKVTGCPAFRSMTRNLEAIKGKSQFWGAVLWTIAPGAHGKSIEFVSAHPDEFEVLYIPDAWFETTAVKGDSKKKQMVEISERQVPHP